MHKETKSTSIHPLVKKAVYERDGGHCIICWKQGNPWCHYIPRSQGGMGIEQNIVTLCNECHAAFDQGNNRKEFKDFIRHYLKSIYPQWNEEMLVYKKGM